MWDLTLNKTTTYFIHLSNHIKGWFVYGWTAVMREWRKEGQRNIPRSDIDLWSVQYPQSPPIQSNPQGYLIRILKSILSIPPRQLITIAHRGSSFHPPPHPFVKPAYVFWGIWINQKLNCIRSCHRDDVQNWISLNMWTLQEMKIEQNSRAPSSRKDISR